MCDWENLVECSSVRFCGCLMMRREEVKKENFELVSVCGAKADELGDDCSHCFSNNRNFIIRSQNM